MAAPAPPLLQRLRPLLVFCPIAGLIGGFACRLAGLDDWAALVFGASAVPVIAALSVEIVTSLRRGDVGLDIVALLSMSAALTFGEELAAAVVALMYSGGQYLESYAEGRARRDMTALLGRVPRTVMRHRDGGLEEVDLDDIRPGDRVLVRRGDVVPVDADVSQGVAVLDQSALTGEAMPVRQNLGEPVMSGSTNVGEAFDVVATRLATDSTYAGIVRLVDMAQRSKAPMSRLADRYAIGFLGLTLAIAGLAWFFSGDPIRAVAVLVVATPCPLILAVPVAIVSGLSRAAKHGILVKGGKALETMARLKVLVVDKTGTLTDGRARLVGVHPLADIDAAEILRLAASLDQASKHVVAAAIVAAATAQRLRLSVPSHVTETPGEGIAGLVDGRRIAIGGGAFVRAQLTQPAVSGSDTTPGEAPAPGALVVAVAIDGRLTGEIVLADTLRPGIAALLADLRHLGLERVVLATGDRRDIASAMVDGLKLDGLHADLTPEQKVLVVLSERKNGPVMMIGDGVNDAPALAAADIGLAMGARGAAASAEAADVVLLVDEIDRVAPALRIARRSRAIALQSVVVGIGLSLAGMIAAAFGIITPVQGALLQEVIDVAAILNALRALQGDGSKPRQVRTGEPAIALRPG